MLTIALHLKMWNKVFVYGISSKIPRSFFHYLILDVDDRDKSEADRFLSAAGIRPIWKRSPHGWHGYYFAQQFSFEELYHFVPLVPLVDESWFRIGAHRGYWFLADYERPFLPPKPMMPNEISYMRLKVPEKCAWVRTKRQIG